MYVCMYVCIEQRPTGLCGAEIVCYGNANEYSQIATKKEAYQKHGIWCL